MICKHCGENLPDNARVCDTCGKRVKKDEPLEFKVEPSPIDLKGAKMGPVFKEVFSGKNMIAIAIVLSVVGIADILSVIGDALAKDYVALVSSTAQIIPRLFVIFAVWGFCFKPKTDRAADYIKPLKMFYFYAVMKLISVAVIVVFAAVLTVVLSGFDFLEFLSAVFTVVLYAFPFFAICKFIKSLSVSAKEDTKKVEYAGWVKGFLIAIVIYFVLIFPVLVIALIDIPLMNLGEQLSIGTMLIKMIATGILIVLTVDWLKTLTAKLEWM